MKLRTLKGKTTEEHIRSADHAIHSLMRRISARPRLESLTPFLLTCYVERGNQVLSYVPVKCRFDIFDIAVDEIEVGEGGKAVAVATIKLATLEEGTILYEVPLKKGAHVVKKIDKEIVSPTKITISFDKPVSAWICLVAYPLIAKMVQVEEEERYEGVQLPLIESTTGDQS